MDTVFLRGLEVDCVIGVFDWEREAKQKVVIDLDMDWDIRPAARDDDLARAVDWKSVTKAVLAYVGDSRFKLVESLAERVAEMVIRQFDVPRVRVRVEKPGAVRYSSTVGVDIVRTREDFPGVTLSHIGLGSNVDARSSIRSALALLREEHRLRAVSPFYESAAEGMDADPFLNGVVAVETTLPAADLVTGLKRLEVLMGRPRDHDAWTPRTLDADLLLHGDRISDVPRLPDPDILSRPWVLVPLVDVAPDLVHPEDGRTLRDILAGHPGWRERLTRCTEP